ncbi:ArsR/SmtB family transcription factor [Hutsoniella sourekii]|uniref:ArsR/SmtB family transcription factor n=1 Tax=Hutsoniella sourekii TaxID=87650 RepID=UPI0004B25F0A|nr:metalloregulator ArsR/SmtB family transcription factor [Hutsoniella sourekii]
MNNYQCMEDEAIDQMLCQMNQLIDPDELERLAALFKVLGDLNRIKIIELLHQQEQLCVYEISRFIDATVATTSHHLITLRNQGIIDSVKVGKRVVYSLNKCEVVHLLASAKQISNSCQARQEVN